MGSRGPLPAKRQQPLYVVGRTDGVPEPVEVLGDAGMRAWGIVWSLPWAAPINVMQLERYCSLQDERVEVQGIIAREGRTATGSMGQEVESPAVLGLRKIDSELLRLEQVIGIGSLFQARLGVAVADLKEREESLNAKVSRSSRRPEDDPRLKVV